MALDGSPRSAAIAPSVLDDAETLTESLERLASDHPGLECLTVLDRQTGEQRLTIQEFWARSRAIQSALVEWGLRPGDFALLILETGSELVSAYFGVMLAGGVPGVMATPWHRLADPRTYAAHVGKILQNADAAILYTNAKVAHLFEQTPPPGRAVVLTPETLPQSPREHPIHRSRPEDVAAVQYSSGTTGLPKGVLLSHRAILNYLRDLRDGLGLSVRDVSVNWVPLHHDMGLIGAFLLPLLMGSRTVLIPTQDFLREPILWLRAIQQHRATLTWAPNFAFAFCTQRIPDPQLSGLDLSSWRVSMNASEPVLTHTIDAFAERFAPYGFRAEAMTPSWGLAETVMVCTVHPVGDAPLVDTVDRALLSADNQARPAAGGIPLVSVGRRLPNCEVQIRDDDGRVLADRQVGSVWLKTTYLMSGYHRDPALTARAIVDGWLYSGDRGYLVGEDLFFVSREKDLIVIAGAKYTPHDVETAINSVQGVREGCAIAFGLLDEDLGTEELAAVVETREEDETRKRQLAEAIRAAVRKSTGLTLRRALLVPPGGIEKTTSGKLARGATRQRYLDQLRA